MSLIFGQPGALPGPLPSLDSIETNFLWNSTRFAVLTGGSVVDGTNATDPGNPTSIYELRAGLAMGMISATNKYKQWDPTASDGSENFQGFLALPLKVKDFNGNAVDRHGILVVGGCVKAANIFTSASPYAMTNYLRGQAFGRFIFDDGFSNAFADNGFSVWQTKTTNYTLTANDNGKLFNTLGAAGAVTFTLPALTPGYKVRFFNAVGQNMIITRAGTDTIVAFNNAAATTLTYSTAGNLIGACSEIIGQDTKWFHSQMCPNTCTVT